MAGSFEIKLIRHPLNSLEMEHEDGQAVFTSILCMDLIQFWAKQP